MIIDLSAHFNFCKAVLLCGRHDNGFRDFTFKLF